MTRRIAAALVIWMTCGPASSSAQQMLGLKPSADSLGAWVPAGGWVTVGQSYHAALSELLPQSVPIPSDDRFAVSWLLGTLGSAGGLFVGGALGVALADDELGGLFFGALLGSTFGSGLGAAVGSETFSVLPYLGSAIGCVAALKILQLTDGREAILYFPAQGLVAALFAQAARE
jgi:hypothetical protein